MELSEAWPYLAAGGAAAGFVNGLAGFGTALFALGFFLSVVPPVQAVALVLVITVIAGAQGMWLVRQSVMDNLDRLGRFLIPAFAGIPLGLWLLSYLDPRTLKLLIGGFLIFYGAYFSLRRALPKITRPMPWADVAVGFAGGILGGAASLSGALPSVWCSLRGWPKAETRAVLQPFNVIILGATAVVLAFQGVFDRALLLALAIALPCAIAAAHLGLLFYKRLSDAAFQRVVIALCFVSGAVLLAREAMAALS